MSNSKGFTLIELLIVITILGILATSVFLNYKSSSSDRQLDKAISEIQSFLRLAQSNAAAGVRCNGVGGAYWGVYFESDTQLKLGCGLNDIGSIQKSLLLTDVSVYYQSNLPCTVSSPILVIYAPLTTTARITPFSGTCSKATIILTDFENEQQKSFTIEKGGAVDVE